MIFYEYPQYKLHSFDPVNAILAEMCFLSPGLVASAGGALGHASPSTDVIDAHLAVQGTIRCKSRPIKCTTQNTCFTMLTT
jgi:hypothetical protein